MRLKCSFFKAKIVLRKLSTSLKIGLTVCNSKLLCVIKLVNHNVLIQYPLHCLWDYWGVKHGDSAFYAAWRTSSHHSNIRNNLEMERVKKTIDTYEGCFQWSPPCLSTKSVIKSTAEPLTMFMQGNCTIPTFYGQSNTNISTCHLWCEKFAKS